MFFTAYTFKGQVHVAFKGQVHVFAGRVKIVKSLVLQDKCNIDIFLSPVLANICGTSSGSLLCIGISSIQ